MSLSPPVSPPLGASQSFAPPTASQLDPARANPRKQRCEICRSKKLFLQDGRLWCRRCGSLQEGFVQTQQEDDYGTLRSSQVTKQKKDKTEKVKKNLSGTKALCLYISTYQLILQHLCRALIDNKGLPETLEGVVKDLWELRINLIYQRYLATQPRDLDDDDEQSDNTLYSSQTETEYSQTDAEESTDAGGGLPSKVRQERDFPNVVDMLGLCYIGCVILRVPLSIGTLSSWAIREEIPFLWPLRLVPLEMQQRLSQRWLAFLQTRALLQPSKLHVAIHDLGALYSRHFSITLPSLNYAPLLHHYIITLSLPIDLFPAVSQLSTILGKSFAFSNPQRHATFIFLPEVQLLAFLIIASKLFHPFPEVDHLPPSSNISPTDHKQILGLVPLNWLNWRAARQKQRITEELQAGPLQPSDYLKISPKDVFSLTTDQIDSYLDWFEETWTESGSRRAGGTGSTSGEESDTGDDSQGGVLREIIKMFSASRHPVNAPSASNVANIEGSTQSEDEDTRIRRHGEQAIVKIQASVNHPRVFSNKTTERSLPGQNYPHYRYPSDLGEPDNPARIFHESVAEMAGLQVSDLLRAVYRTERKFVRWWRKERARRAQDQEDVMTGAEEGEDELMVDN